MDIKIYQHFHIIDRKQIKYRQIAIPPLRRNVPIQPGLFKGNYGGHGIELIMVTYNDDNSQMNTVKITVRFTSINND